MSSKIALRQTPSFLIICC